MRTTTGTLFAAWWQYDSGEGETLRLSCAHIHGTKGEAEACGRRLNAQVDMIRHGHIVIDSSHVAERLARQDFDYLGVRQEDGID